MNKRYNSLTPFYSILISLIDYLLYCFVFFFSLSSQWFAVSFLRPRRDSLRLIFVSTWEIAIILHEFLQQSVHGRHRRRYRGTKSVLFTAKFESPLGSRILVAVRKIGDCICFGDDEFLPTFTGNEHKYIMVKLSFFFFFYVLI